MRFLRLSVRPGWLQATFSAVNRAVYVYMYAESEWKNNTNIFRTLLLVESRVYEFQRRRKRKRDLHSKIRSLHKKAGFILPGRFFFKKIQRVRRVEDWFSLKKKKKKGKEKKRKERKKEKEKNEELSCRSCRISRRKFSPHESCHAAFFFLILRVSASLQRTAEEERDTERHAWEDFVYSIAPIRERFNFCAPRARLVTVKYRADHYSRRDLQHSSRQPRRRWMQIPYKMCNNPV